MRILEKLVELEGFEPSSEAITFRLLPRRSQIQPQEKGVGMPYHMTSPEKRDVALLRIKLWKGNFASRNWWSRRDSNPHPKRSHVALYFSTYSFTSPKIFDKVLRALNQIEDVLSIEWLYFNSLQTVPPLDKSNKRL